MFRPCMTSSAIGLTTTAPLFVAVICQPYAGELPAGLRWKEVAIRSANMRAWRGARAAAQYHLPAHEFSVVLAQRARRGFVSGIGKIGAGGPLPYIAEH